MSRLPESNFGGFRGQLLQSANWASQHPPSVKADIVRHIIKSSTFDDHTALLFDNSFELVSEAEILEAAYSDARGYEYFQGWLQDEYEDINRTIDLLALHLAKQAEVDADWRDAHRSFRNGSLAAQIRGAFISAAKSKCDWISCSGNRTEFHDRLIDNFINFGPNFTPFEIQAKRLSAIKWMCGQPWYAKYVPDAMRRIICPLNLEDRSETPPIAEASLPRPVKRKVGREKGSGLQKYDRLLFQEIEEILKKGQANAADKAALLISHKIVGHGTPENRALRVARLYNKERKQPS